MKSDEKMSSFCEIVRSKEFKSKAPEGFTFNIRKVLHDRNSDKSHTTQKVINKKKISGLAK